MIHGFLPPLPPAKAVPSCRMTKDSRGEATLLFQTPLMRADDNRDHRDAIITWTKHVTA
ncbi:MAG: hypothetical protein L0Z50_09375 [Verrucomicrobiales bacterium]|nr:hypothetical protein [Verrucomicrobiales bacterium]